VWNELSNDGTWFSLFRPRSVDDEAAKFAVGTDPASIETTGRLFEVGEGDIISDKNDDDDDDDGEDV
jgi:hypothetical protein